MNARHHELDLADLDHYTLHCPEKSLWAAVLLQAIADFKGGIAQRKRRNKKYVHGSDAAQIAHASNNAAIWLSDDSNQEKVNSFSAICRLLDLDPIRVRRILQQKLTESSCAETPQ